VAVERENGGGVQSGGSAALYSSRLVACVALLYDTEERWMRGKETEADAVHESGNACSGGESEEKGKPRKSRGAEKKKRYYVAHSMPY